MTEKLEQELRDAGVHDQLRSELSELAQEMLDLPGVEPCPDWLLESKQRLLQHFDEQQTGGPAEH